MAGLLALIVLILVVGGLFVLPMWLAAWSLAEALQAPGQFWAVASNRRLRRNHALEHATINVLEERFGPQRLAGLAREDGFWLKGFGDPALIREAAEEGLARLRRGETRLAVHDRCGTSRAVANLVTALVLVVLLAGFGRFSLVNVLMAILLANLAGPLLGRLFQRLVTTSADVGDLAIIGFECRAATNGWAQFIVNPFRAGLPLVCLVRTAVVRHGR